MRVNYTDAQFVGKSRYLDKENGKSRWYCHFIYQSPYIDGYGTLVFVIYDNNQHIKVSDFKDKEMYHLTYVSDRGFNTLVSVNKI